MNTTSNAERVFYTASVGVSYSGALNITIRTNPGSVSSPKDADGKNITDLDVTDQYIKITNASYADIFVITFSVINGQRAMTITCGSASVTWYEIV